MLTKQSTIAHKNTWAGPRSRSACVCGVMRGRNMDYPERSEIYDYMRELFKAYAPPHEVENLLIYLNQSEEQGTFPAGKWFLHTLDTMNSKSGSSLSYEHKKLYQEICGYCI